MGGGGSGRNRLCMLDRGPSPPREGGRGGMRAKDQNWGLGWVAGSRMKEEGRGDRGNDRVREEGEG